MPLWSLSKFFDDFRLFLLWGAIGCVSAITPNLASATQLQAGVFHQQGPYSYLDAEGKRQGLLVDSLKLLERDGHQLNYRHITHGRLFYELMQGSIDVAFVLIMPNELARPTADSVVVTKFALMDIPLYLYALESGKETRLYPEKFTSITDLEHLQVGLYRASATKNYTGLTDTDNVTFFNRYESAVKSFMSGRIDLLAIDPISADYWQRKYSTSFEQKYFLLSTGVHLAFSTKSLGDDALRICERYWRQIQGLAQEDRLNEQYQQFQDTELMSFFSAFDQREEHYCQSLENNG